MTLAKGIGAGFPLSALLARDACCVGEKGDPGGTCSGQPLAMAVGLLVHPPHAAAHRRGAPHVDEAMGVLEAIL